MNIVPGFDVASLRDFADLIGEYRPNAKPSAGIRPIDITFSTASDMLYRARNADSAKLQRRRSQSPLVLKQFEIAKCV